MIRLFYPPETGELSYWKTRLEQLALPYQLAELERGNEPRLIDGEKEFTGAPAISTYLEELQQFVNGWYEDRCDRYEFDPDAGSGLQL